METKQVENPIEASVAWLCDCGFNQKEARNLCAAVYSDKSGEHLWEIAPKWIQYCGDLRKEYESVVGLAAMGLIKVTYDGDELYMKIRDELREKYQSPEEALAALSVGVEK